MRNIVDHKESDLNQFIDISADDRDEAHGNASHYYEIALYDGADAYRDAIVKDRVTLHFQRGAVKEVGVNGISDEALLAILIDRLRSFQSGEVSCRQNACALTKLEEAQHWMKDRTQDRKRRGVEGRAVK